MKLEDTREAYQFYTGKVSDIIRQLGLAAIALVWVFKSDVNGRPVIPPELITAAEFTVVGLGLDLLQYVTGAAIWGSYNRYKERQGTSVTTEFEAPRQLNWATIAFFWLKVIAILVSYGYILRFLENRLLS